MRKAFQRVWRVGLVLERLVYLLLLNDQVLCKVIHVGCHPEKSLEELLKYMVGSSNVLIEITSQLDDLASHSDASASHFSDLANE